MSEQMCRTCGGALDTGGRCIRDWRCNTAAPASAETDMDEATFEQWLERETLGASKGGR